MAYLTLPVKTQRYYCKQRINGGTGLNKTLPFKLSVIPFVINIFTFSKRLLQIIFPMHVCNFFEVKPISGQCLKIYDECKYLCFI